MNPLENMEIFLMLLIAGLVIRYCWKESCYHPFKMYLQGGFENLEIVARKKKRKLNYLINDGLEFKKNHNNPSFYLNAWIPVFDSDRLARGMHMHICRLDTFLVIFRLNDGELCIFNDDKMLKETVESCNLNRDDYIKCPSNCSYKKEADILRSRPNLKEWICQEVNGFAFVWYHADGHSPTWNVSEVPEISSGEFICKSRFAFIAYCHTQEIQENVVDTAHAKGIHGDDILRYSKGGDNTKRIINGYVYETDLKISSKPEIKHLATLNSKWKLHLWNFKISDATFDLNFVGPGVMIHHFRIPFITEDLIAIIYIIPERPNRTILFLKYYIKESFYGQFLINLFMKDIVDQTIRDITIWNNKIYQKNPKLVKEEKSVQNFRRWTSQFYADKFCEHEYAL